MAEAYETIIKAVKAHRKKTQVQIAVILLMVTGFSYYTGIFDPVRLFEGVPSILELIAEGFPPNFSAALTWFLPLLDTLAMSVAGKALALMLALPLGFMGARNTAPNAALYQIVRTILNVLR